MDINLLLKDLVNSVDGATGALLLEADGEAIGWYSLTDDNDQLRLRGAYVAVVMRGFREFGPRTSIGKLKRLIIAYENANLIAEEVDLDCWIVLELKPLVSVGPAIHRMQTASDRFRQELTS